MAAGVYIPIWGLQMEEATLTNWLKNEGEAVAQGEAIAVIETFKISGEVESPAAGVLLRQVGEVGQVLKVGSLLAVVGEPGEGAAEADKLVQERPFVTEQAVSEPKLAGTQAPAPAGAAAASRPGRCGPLRATPLARKLARESGLELSAVTGSGRGGRVYAGDVRKALQRAEAPALGTAPEDRVVPLSGLRRAIIQKTMQTVDIPYGALSRTVRADRFLAFRKELGPAFEAKCGLKLGVTHLLFKAAAHALEEVPILNAGLEGENIVIHGSKNVGMVVTPPGGGGILIPVIRNVQAKSLIQIAREWSEITDRIQDGSQSLEDLSGGTFTVSNVGALGIDVFTPLIHPPEAAILGVTRVVDTPVVEDGTVVPGKALTLIVGADHRVFDADPIGEFLATMDRLFQNPAELLL
jgi:pyruvate dehydrogenase E2 component (dihydrolipoamide acetyltransferase)